jgi:nicotinamidase-related amidase
LIPKSPGFIRGECVNLTGKPADIVPELTATPNDPLVASTVDKFYNTDLGQNLADHQIKTVIITGTAANGAVLHTATGASFRGYEVIVPVDCMFANDLYAEQYTAWHMLNSPGTRRKASLSTADQITF